MTEASNTGAGLQFSQDAPTPPIATVPDHIIPAELPHPTTSGPPLARGAKYLHHFEVELISDGKRLWALATEEGRAVAAWIRGEQDAHAQAIEDHKASVRVANEEANAAAANPPTKVLPPPMVQEVDAGGNLVFDEQGQPRMVPNPALAG